jgi:hypothetical protein
MHHVSPRHASTPWFATLLFVAGCSSSEAPGVASTTPSQDAAASAVDAGVVAAPDASGAADSGQAPDADASDHDAALSSRDFVCTEVIGVSVTGDWFTSGFETHVDNARWQAVYATHAFVELWADPANALWSTAPTSPCAQKSSAPDRVIFTGVNFTYTTAQEWITTLTKVIETLKGKYPALKRVDLMTMLRAPNNVSCGNSESVVAPFIDDAIAKVVEAFPGFVIAAPKTFAPTCDVFVAGGPHFTDAGKTTIANVYGDYYANEP